MSEKKQKQLSAEDMAKIAAKHDTYISAKFIEGYVKKLIKDEKEANRL